MGGYKEKMDSHHTNCYLVIPSWNCPKFKKVSLTNFILKRCAGVSIPDGKKVRLVNEGYENAIEIIKVADK
jgi:hypothetical protein